MRSNESLESMPLGKKLERIGGHSKSDSASNSEVWKQAPGAAKGIEVCDGKFRTTTPVATAQQPLLKLFVPQPYGQDEYMDLTP